MIFFFSNLTLGDWSAKWRIFSGKEISSSKKYTNKINYFSKRFAAKESFVKSIGYGLGTLSLGIMPFSNNVNATNNENKITIYLSISSDNCHFWTAKKNCWYIK